MTVTQQRRLRSLQQFYPLEIRKAKTQETGSEDAPTYIHLSAPAEECDAPTLKEPEWHHMGAYSQES